MIHEGYHLLPTDIIFTNGKKMKGWKIIRIGSDIVKARKRNKVVIINKDTILRIELPAIIKKK